MAGGRFAIRWAKHLGGVAKGMEGLIPERSQRFNTLGKEGKKNIEEWSIGDFQPKRD